MLLDLQPVFPDTLPIFNNAGTFLMQKKKKKRDMQESPTHRNRDPKLFLLLLF